MCLSFPPTGLHHDSIPPPLLERRASVLPEHQQPKHDIWQPPGEEDLGPRHVLRPFQALLHPRHHHGQRDAEGLPRWERPLQPQVTKHKGKGGWGRQKRIRRLRLRCSCVFVISCFFFFCRLLRGGCWVFQWKEIHLENSFGAQQ